ncbi:spindle pole body component 110-like isoform X2 [Bombus vosnesenskii]|uniref:Spindle pole body component 110-like isoform X2 n=2 Tax=Pyrobombus TaxID=144703 RepID=A0A6J3L377_9HYME|nr:spindle pole body component 110-like isoform X2 [Bombus vancouverensis nearcticus]XP_033304334.1 spindle pole body component 110-like isoform X2 [Bombus bifarius]XP_033358906.1 spindle pole body component 110-like isoform X2 [Bombus vosnesenskii]
MDNLSDSFKGELDSVTSTDSLQLMADEFHIRHLSTPDVSNIELSKRVALLELENERLRIDLENMRIELNARIAANEGLKGKITELYVEMQLVVQEKQKLQNTLTDVKNHLDASEASVKWYQSQVHGLQASKKTLQLEIDTYQGILQQRQQTIANINARYKQLNIDYTELLQKHRKEKQDLEYEVQNLKTQNQSNSILESLDINTSSSPDVSTKLELTEDELRDTKAELKTLEKRLLGNEVSKTLMENALAKQRILITTMEENIQKCETEKNQTADTLRKTQLEIQKLKSENEALQTTLLSSKQEQSQIEDAIFQLRLQLTKMIAQYKLLKSKNIEAEEKLNSMQDVINENKRLKTLSYEANTALIRKLRQEKRKVKSLENKLHGIQIKGHLTTMNKMEVSLHECLKQVLMRNKDLKDQLKALAKTSDESIDEGYGDNSIVSSVSIDIPSPKSISPVLLDAASNILLQCKDFYKPVQTELEQLKLKLNKLKEQYTT